MTLKKSNTQHLCYQVLCVLSTGEIIPGLSIKITNNSEKRVNQNNYDAAKSGQMARDETKLQNKCSFNLYLNEAKTVILFNKINMCR